MWWFPFSFTFCVYLPVLFSKLSRLSDTLPLKILGAQLKLVAKSIYFGLLSGGRA